MLRSVRRIAFAGLFGYAFASSAQTKSGKGIAEAPASYGAVAGHLYFAGSNAPVRFGTVALQPIDVAGTTPAEGKPSTQQFTIYETDLAGDFHIPHVRTGTYYIVARYPGSLSPFATFTQAEMQHPSEEVAKRIAATIPVITVRPSDTATLTVALQRGASLSGAVRFDDGTPFADASLRIERHGSDGKWAAPNAADANANTDKDGHWSLGGLAAGEYRLSVSLAQTERQQTALLGNNFGSWSNSSYSVPVYLGDTSRQKDAKTITFEEGQQAAGQDITIPVSKMHTVTGAVVDKRSGQPVNGGTVSVLDTDDDDKQVCSATIDPESRTFSVPFLMEGKYKLTVNNPREIRIETTPYPPGEFGTPQTKETLLRAYAPGEMPLLVQNDVSGLSLAVEPKASKIP